MDENEKNKKILEKYGKNFCAAPFTSIYEGEHGLLTTCCKASRTPIGNINNESYEDAINSEYAKQLRVDILNGKKSNHCENCWFYEDNEKTISPPRKFNNAMSYNVIDEVISTMDEDGKLNVQKPAWLDLLSSNNCNFSCLGCSPNLSSSIAKKFKTEFSILHNHKKDYYTEYNDVWSNDNNSRIEYILKYHSSIEKIHFNGGEPFLDYNNYILLEKLLENNLNEKIEIWLHTNGSIDTFKGKNIITDYLKYWGGNSSITMSNDGFGDRGSFIRYGYNDKKWIKIFNSIVDNKIKIGVQSCINIFNINYIPEWGEQLNNIFTERNLDTQDCFLDIWSSDTVNYRMLNICPKTKKRTLKKLKTYLKSDKIPKGWKYQLPSIISTLSKTTDIDTNCVKSLIDGIDALDKVRNVKFLKTFPELINLYNNAKKII